MTIKKRPTWIPVATGFIRKNGLVLVGQRPEGHSLAGQWEFPGGKIELGENPEQALKRELHEELGIEAEIGSLRHSHTHSYGDRAILILFFDVKLWKGEPKSQHHTELKWINPQDLFKMEIPEANRRILPKLLELLK